MDSPQTQLILRPLTRAASGEPIAQMELVPPGPHVIGRSAEADWPIPDQAVSRRHASLTHRDGRWYLTDLSSRHGTSINGKLLATDSHTPIEPGDLIGFGTWTCRCLPATAPTTTATYATTQPARSEISAIDLSRMSGVAQRGLDALLALTQALDVAEGEPAIAQAVVEAVASATGCPRVVITRGTSDTEFETLASTTSEPTTLSRSLIEAAARDGLVELRSVGGQQNQAQSIMDLNIRSAICAPILSGQVPVAFLVLDTRGSEGLLAPDATAFCRSVVQLAGFAFDRLHASLLAARHKQLEQDLDAARRAQELLSPAKAGSHGLVSYVFESLAGRVVAGDLFDIFPLDADRTAFFLGDVSGKGVGAAVLMAAAQSQLRTHLLSGAAVAEAVGAVSADLCRRTESSKFVTLIAGVIDSARETIEIVDAGHGLCALKRPDAEPVRLDAPTGFPLGIVEQAEYESLVEPFTAGTQVVVFSDGAVEQPDASGEQFGFDAVLKSIERGLSPETMTKALIDDVRSHAAGELADDLTVAAIMVAGERIERSP